MRIVLVAGFLFTLLALAPRAAAVTLEPVGTFDEPIFVTAPLGDPRLFVVERAGRIQLHHDGVWTYFLDIHTLTTTDGERGLLSIAFDPNYAANGLFYVFFTDSGSGGAALGDIHIDEFRVSADQEEEVQEAPTQSRTREDRPRLARCGGDEEAVQEAREEAIGPI
jgi:Glucose / Sorbosone dehydrogenase